MVCHTGPGKPGKGRVPASNAALFINDLRVCPVRLFAPGTP